MANTVIVLTEEFLKRVQVALGEIPAKFAIPVIQEIEAWITLAEHQPAKVIELVDKHLQQFRDKVAAEEAALKAEAAKALAAVEAEAKKVASPVESVVHFVEGEVKKVESLL